MIQDKYGAEQAAKAFQEAFRQLDESARLTRERGEPQEAREYAQRVGKVLYEIVFTLMELLYDEHPELKPLGWDVTN